MGFDKLLRYSEGNKELLISKIIRKSVASIRRKHAAVTCGLISEGHQVCSCPSEPQKLSASTHCSLYFRPEEKPANLLLNAL